MAHPDWRPWTAATFARARREGKLVLLSIVAPWCAASRAMDAGAFADPGVLARLADGFVAIRVDAERRPDIADRYDLGGWPTTAFLNPAGTLLGGGTFAEAPTLAARLDRARAAVAADGALLEAPDREDPPAPGGAVPDVVPLVLAAFDAAHGGFGGAPKYPHAAAVTLALDLGAETGDDRTTALAIASLDAIGWGQLADPVDGGFFRCCDLAGWEAPRTEKLLDVNAALLALYTHAATVLDADRYVARAADTLRYLQTWLADQEGGGWYGWQGPDPDYYADADPVSRAARTPPPVDRLIPAAANAAAVSAVLGAARAFADDGLAAFAVRSFERLSLACYRPGTGFAHEASAGAVRGLLADHVGVATAALDVFDATGNIVYEMLAEELMRFAWRTMWDEAAGAFLDRMPADAAEAVGRLGRRHVPFAANCAAARLLRRLAAASGEAEFAGLADRILEVTGRLAPLYGPDGAHHALALRAARGR